MCVLPLFNSDYCKFFVCFLLSSITMWIQMGFAALPARNLELTRPMLALRSDGHPEIIQPQIQVKNVRLAVIQRFCS